MKYLKILVLIVAFSSLNACTDWLSISPETEVDSETLLSDESGYFNAVHGLYYKMLSSSLYGEQLTMSFTDVLGQYYYFDDKSSYYDLSSYAFEEEATKVKIENIWTEAYNVVANANNIISSYREDPSTLRENVGGYVLAQALGLRALVHFDLLRLFHVPYAMNKDFVAIPYVTQVSKEPSPQLSSQSIINKVLEDLLQAHEYLKLYDPFYKDNSKEGFALISEERIYLNYYALSALLARVYLYAGNHEKALEYANIVIESGKYGFIKESEIQSRKDFLFENEILLGLHYNDIQEMTYGGSDGSTGTFSPSGTLLQGYTLEELSSKLYLNPEDIRYLNWFMDTGGGGLEYTVVKKYFRENVLNEEDEEIYPTLPMVPVIKYGEVVLIAAEAKAKLNSVEEGLTTLNLLQKARKGYESVAADWDTFIDDLKMEYRREFYGEGQTYYMHKRLESSVIDFVGSEVELNESNYFLPLPDDEVLYGGRK